MNFIRMHVLLARMASALRGLSAQAGGGRSRCALALAICAAVAVGAAGTSSTSYVHHGRAGIYDARASRPLVGLGDEQRSMFASPLWQGLRTHIARYIAPYDAAVRPASLSRARAWIEAAEAQHQQILVAFYHSDFTPTRLPSVRAYQRDVRRFVKLFRHVRVYQPWDEANRGNVRGRFASPSAPTAARYYQALKRACTTCQVAGVDVLDQNNPRSTLRYIAAFKHEIRRLKTVMPRLWGVHNYSDVNRFQAWRTREVDRALGGTIWLTETGGIVKFGRAFPDRNGAGIARAARVLKFALGLLARERRIKAVYVYDWTGTNGVTTFDAGLTDRRGFPRPAYSVLCRYLLHNDSRCQVAVSWA